MRQKNKDTYGFTLVAIGLLIGFFLGAGIVYWYSNRPEKPFITGNTLNHFSKLWQTADDFMEGVINYTHIADPQPITDNTPQTQIASIARVENNAENQSPENDTRQITDTLAIPEGELLLNDSLPVSDGQNDSETVSIAYIAEPIYDESASAIIVKKDELIGMRAFLLPAGVDNHHQSGVTHILDSLMGRPHTSEHNRKNIFIEFWESPFNYTGYKMTKNRIVVYGIQQIDFISLIEIDNNLFLKYNEDFFPIKATMDFKPLIPVSDPFLVNKSDQ